MSHSTSWRLRLPAGITLVASCLVLAVNVNAQDSSFTYQGELRQNGNLANGTFDMDYSLWDSEDSGSQAGQTVSQTNVPVTDGTFTVELDFGPEPFDNNGRWLQIVVDGFVLDPRTKITRSPYSLQTRGLFVDAQQNVGIGTTNPQTQLDLESIDESTIRLTTANNNPGLLSKLQFKTFDAPGVFSPLGRIDFVDEQDNLRAFVQGTKIGTANAQLILNVTPGEVSQVTISSNNVTVGPDLTAAGNLDVASDLSVGNLMTVESDLSVGNQLSVESNLFVGNQLSVTSDLFVGDSLIAGQDVFVQEDLEVVGDLSVSGIASMGTHNIHPALAYAHVNINTNVVTGSTNVDQVAAISTGRYRITIEGGFAPGDIILVTTEHHLKNASARRDPADLSKAIVEIADVTTGQFSHENHSFVVYRK